MKWEYIIVTTNRREAFDSLNKYGFDGWELISVIQNKTNYGGLALDFYMKREKRP